MRTSDKPGLTQQLNFYSVGRLFNIIDMPGYGFAFADEDKRRQWRELVRSHIVVNQPDDEDIDMLYLGRWRRI